MTTENFFVGGPYNGNTFHVDPTSESYSLTSHASSYAVEHRYDRTDSHTFTYRESLVL